MADKEVVDVMTIRNSNNFDLIVEIERLTPEWRTVGSIFVQPAMGRWESVYAQKMVKLEEKKGTE